LTLTYRFGRWQYGNHTHIVDLIANAARVQHVDPAEVSGVVRSIYRAALDIAFRRSGGLFVLLRNRQNLRKTVRQGDAIGDRGRPKIDASFDGVLDDLYVQTSPRTVVAELAALDGAVVLANTGQVLAYGAVLDPQRKGRLRAAEGSRTKAAIGASNYGLAIKISSDGDITAYVGGKHLIRI
jgi:DNA integrity scanning protein DisA with diadenylate cyclase activity